jgi:polyhydroxyalkanoate synthase subunit PhaE
MNETSKSSGQQWLDSQQAMWKAFLPGVPTATTGTRPAATPLEEQFNELRDTWQASVARWSDFAKEAPNGEMPSADKLREMFAPAAWAHGAGPGSGVLDATLQRVLEGPRYAVLWDLDRQVLELQKLTLQRDKAVAAYQAVVNKAWNLAFQRFTKVLGSKQPLAAALTWRSLADQWLAVANDTLIEVHRSEEFIDAQRRMLRAASERHLQERKIAEAWCDAAHVPTRSEVDELQRHVIELRREVRLLRRATPVAVEPTPARTTRQTPARRPRAVSKPGRS